tara:strand:- start:685 stop:1356 length:672 start_codon:yes stop_codon:yes gene_type:complete
MKKILITTAAAMFASVNAFAASLSDMSFGVSGTALYYDASGTETTKSSGQTADKSDSGVAPMASIFAEMETGTGVIVGLELMPYSAKVGSGAMNSDDDNETSGVNSVDVNFKNHVTLYAEYPNSFTDGGFFKAGIHRVTVETDDSLSTGSKYGDEDLTGFMIGIGKRGDTPNGFYKIAAEVSYYGGETFNAATGGNTTGDGSVFNKVELDDLMTAGIKFSVGF